MTDYCQVCGCKITEENATNYSNVCKNCAGGLAEGIMHLFG